MTVLAGYSNRFMSQKSRLLPTIDVGFELYIVRDERSGISGQRISITRISGQPESRKVQVDYSATDWYPSMTAQFSSSESKSRAPADISRAVLLLDSDYFKLA